MIGTSVSSLIFIRACIFVLKSVAPISIVYTAYTLISRNHALPLIIEVWFAAETLFYFCWYLPWSKRLQKPAPHPAPHTPDERRELFGKCISTITSPTEYLSGWFHGAPWASVHKENLAEFLTWGFLDRDSPPAPDSEEAAELEEYLEAVKHELDIELPPGYNPDAKSLRLTLDPVRMSHRSLLWYGMMHVVDVFTSARLAYRGFKLFPTAGWLEVFPGRPHAPLVSTGVNSPAKDLSYWFRPHTSDDKLPVVFLHGLGVGMYPYVPFLGELVKELGEDVGIIAVEIMPISTRICGDPTTPAEFSKQILEILNFHGIGQFVLVAHSYGTILATHLLHCPQSSAQINSLVLIDPVVFLLHLPNVAYNFTSRPPRLANERLLEYFASRDPGISHTICRHFFWTQNILWKEELKGKKCAVALGRRDLLVNTEKVWVYLTGEEMRAGVETEDRVWGAGEELKVFWYAKCDHAQIFDTMERRRRLVGAVREFSGGRETRSYGTM
ncbi:hypothetical protein K440DRAFT_592879 [Wilcoxina mikolae CBS 423.85]|nr:hypothetical protein K440DRAFT_592879 [Wilcoxina mikolae CBS 423.85]